jgi:hypothetical protein
LLFGLFKTYTSTNKRTQNAYLYAGIFASCCSLIYVDVAQCLSSLYHSIALNAMLLPLYSYRNTMALC